MNHITHPRWIVYAVLPTLQERFLAMHTSMADAQNDAQKYQRFLGSRVTVRINPPPPVD